MMQQKENPVAANDEVPKNTGASFDTSNNSEETLTRQAAWRLANPEKYAAHLAVQRAKSRGELSAETCADCGRGGRIDHHHDDYRHPLKTIPLCRSCHTLRHRRRAG